MTVNLNIYHKSRPFSQYNLDYHPRLADRQECKPSGPPPPSPPARRCHLWPLHHRSPRVGMTGPPSDFSQVSESPLAFPNCARQASPAGERRWGHDDVIIWGRLSHLEVCVSISHQTVAGSQDVPGGHQNTNTEMSSVVQDGHHPGILIFLKFDYYSLMVGAVKVTFWLLFLSNPIQSLNINTINTLKYLSWYCLVLHEELDRMTILQPHPSPSTHAGFEAAENSVHPPLLLLDPAAAVYGVIWVNFSGDGVWVIVVVKVKVESFCKCEWEERKMWITV